MGNRLTGRKFFLLRGSFFLYKGKTCACFSPAGNLPDLYVVFIRFEIVPLTVETYDFRIFAEILSTPVDFLMFKLDITLCTYVSVVGLNENWRLAGFLQCNGGKLEEAEDFKSFIIVYCEFESKKISPSP